MRRQPSFIHPNQFKWGIPLISLLLFFLGLLLIYSVKPSLAAGACAVALLLTFLLMKFDRYSGHMRLIHDRYLRIREANAVMDEREALFHTAQWRYPQWPEERVLELVAGKNIEALILLMIVNENEISPIADWELYRSLKGKAARLSQSKKASMKL